MFVGEYRIEELYIVIRMRFCKGGILSDHSTVLYSLLNEDFSILNAVTITNPMIILYQSTVNTPHRHSINHPLTTNTPLNPLKETNRLQILLQQLQLRGLHAATTLNSPTHCYPNSLHGPLSMPKNSHTDLMIVIESTPSP